MAMNKDTIQVIARFRPPNSGIATSIAISDARITIGRPKDGPNFAFDAVFKAADQLQIYQCAAKQIVQDVFEGYNGTIFAYGQTGSGKTHTMMGPDDADEATKGVIPRVVDALFSTIDHAENTTEFTVKVSYVEIYMERIRDLLNPARTNLQLHEDQRGGRGVYVGDTTEIYVTTAEEMLDLLSAGGRHRTVAATRMNEQSSRSHAVFQVTLTQRHATEHRTGKLVLVDLAGSERASKTRVGGQQLEEAKLINRSLSTLGLVIKALTDGSSHVPYRDSKLTRLLQDSVGGNSRTSLIVCCSADASDEPETLSTLRFGERAKRIKNKAQVNREWTVEELKARLARAEREIDRLRQLTGVTEPLEALHSAAEWEEVNAMLDQLTAENEGLRALEALPSAAEWDALEGRAAFLEAENGELRALVEQQRQRIAGLEGELEDLRDAAAALIPVQGVPVDDVGAKEATLDLLRAINEQLTLGAGRVTRLEQQLEAQRAAGRATEEQARELGRYRQELLEQRNLLAELRRNAGWRGLARSIGRGFARVIHGGRPSAITAATAVAPPTPRAAATVLGAGAAAVATTGRALLLPPTARVAST